MVVFVANFLSVQQCASRPIAHAPRSRLHKLDCKVSRQKVLAASEAGGTAIVIGGTVLYCTVLYCSFLCCQAFY
jgi:hypothetical protein